MSLKEEIAQIFGYYIEEGTTLRAVLSDMDKAGKLDQRSVIEILSKIVEHLDNENK